MRPYLLALLILLGMASPALADGDSSPATAEKLLDVMQMGRTLQRTMDQALDAQLRHNPALATYKNVMREFLNKYMSYESLRPDLVKIYADAFTDQELQELIAFYRTPTGQKALELTPELAVKGAELGMRRVKDHMAELKQMIEAENARLIDSQHAQPGEAVEAPAPEAPASEAPALPPPAPPNGP
jgi:uncharacterized protein